MMKRASFLLVLFASAASQVDAQQIASATFAASSAPVADSSKGSAEFGAPKGETERCERTVTVPCRPKQPPARKKTATLKSPAPPKHDRLAVHPEAAVKDTKAPEIVLPGVMKIAGADAHALDFSRVRIVDAATLGVQVVYVSAIDQNRVELPWVNSKVVGTEELLIDKSADSRSVYVQFKPGVTRGVMVSFRDPASDTVVDLKLEPKEIVGQVVLVRDSRPRLTDRPGLKGNDYVANTQGLMEQIALGAAPQGYSQSDIAVGAIAMNGLVVTPQKLYSSADRDIYVYEVSNPGPQKASLQEKEFDGENVLAISIFPKPILAARERTKVIVMTRKAMGD